MASLDINLQRLSDARDDIAQAIVDKGGIVGNLDGFEDFSTDIATIPGPTPKEPSEFDDVVLYDIDGTIVASYTKEEFLALEDYPTHPDRTSEGLTSDGWTLTFQEAQEIVQTYGIHDIGALYIPTSRCSEVHLEIPSNNYTVSFNTRDRNTGGGSSDGTIDWGDGTTSSVQGTSSHTYSTAGNYIVKFNPISCLNFGGYYYYSQAYNDKFLYSTDTINATKRIYIYVPDNIKSSMNLRDISDDTLLVFSRFGNVSNSSQIRITANNFKGTPCLIIYGNRLIENSSSGGSISGSSTIKKFVCSGGLTTLFRDCSCSSITFQRFACFGGLGYTNDSDIPVTLQQRLFNTNGQLSCLFKYWVNIDTIDLRNVSQPYFSNSGFINCPNLKYIIFGNNYSGGSYTLSYSGCYNLEYIKFTSSTPQTFITKIISSSIVPSKVPKVLIPQGSLSDYVSATGVSSQYFEEY